MPRTPRWVESSIGHGIWTARLHSWKYFNDYIRQEMLDYRTFIWRGQRRSDWTLQSTLGRKLEKKSKVQKFLKEHGHLENFKYAVRGRRGPNPPVLETENDWWALGQHFGLDTPLLDWSASPFVGAFFAFSNTGTKQTTKRIVYALSQNLMKQANARAKKKHKEEKLKGKPSLIEFIRPLSDENARLVNQGGLFTRTSIDIDIETWVKNNFDKDLKYVTLLKIEIPNKDRALCLRSLNRMNINHLTLFPDLTGASTYANMDLEIKNY